MYRSSLFLTAILVGTTVALVQPMASAKSAVEVGRIATAVTVEIKETGKSRVGSGILLQRQGDVYTVLTAGHVVNRGTAFTLKTADGQVHKSIANSVKLSGNNIDLGVVKFRAPKNYTLAKIGTSRSLEALSPIYVAGFPESTYAISAGTLNITRGEVVGNASRGNAKGYSLIYSNTTFRGMSGGPVLNASGELVAIHGQGDRDGKEGEGEKTGRNLGIVVERFGLVASAMGVQLNQRVAVLPQSRGLNASDYSLRAFGKDDSGDYRGALADYNQAILINPKYSLAYYNRALLKENKLNDIKGSLADYNQAILINPKYYLAYNNRALLKESKLNDIKGSLADYNQAILIKPKYSLAYYNRALLKEKKLSDIKGALADYNQAIIIDPEFSFAYNNRALLKKNKLNDIKGALADYNQAIIIDPKSSDAYNNRAFLKANKLNDRPGAIKDFRQAARLFREQGNTRSLQNAIKGLQKLGATE
jgi:tetratricopeptide (TPR) repeat protein